MVTGERAINLGTIISHEIHSSLESLDLPANFASFAAAARGNSEASSRFETAEVARNNALTDAEIMRKGLEDITQAPSIWFVRFPPKVSEDQQLLLRTYQENIRTWHSWASVIWNRTVQTHSKMPKDSSPTSQAARTSFLARVMSQHMRATPWLGTSSDIFQSKKISCKASEFHETLIKDVMSGFVLTLPTIMNALEQVLLSMRRTLAYSKAEVKACTLFFERYEYLPETNNFRSYVRVISFSVTDEIKNITTRKDDVDYLTCVIMYQDYQAIFNDQQWGKAKEQIQGALVNEGKAFVQKQTVDVDP